MMRRFIPELICSLGIAMLVGGALTFIIGMQGGLTLFGLFYGRTEICLLGAILAAIGSGLTVFGIFMIRARPNSN